jgi:hypothetical protein
VRMTELMNGLAFAAAGLFPRKSQILYPRIYKKQLLLLFLLVLPAHATTYTVNAAGGGNYTTIGQCAAVAVAGDNCVIFAGTYNETVTPAHSGSAGSPITYSTNPGDSVTVENWNLGTLSYITIEGTSANPMVITGQVYWSVITNSVFQYINNTSGSSGSCFGGNGWYTSGQPSSSNQFLNLTLAYCGGTTNNNSGAIELEGHYNLFDHISVSDSQAAIILSGQFNVIRNSTFGPTSTAVIGTNHSQPIENSVACGGSNSDIAGGMQHLLYENNYSFQWRGGNSHGTALITDTGSTKCGTTTNVFRLSQTMDSGSYSTEIYDSLNSYFYEDSFSNTQLDAGIKDKEDYQFYPSAPNSRTINNIFANMTQMGSTDWCIYAVTPIVENHNLCFNTGWTGLWYGPTINSSNTYDPSDIFNQDPLFLNPDANLQLQTASPAIGAGGPLTTTVGAGTNSTSLTVADAGYFSWGYGIPNVQPDWIRIGASTTAQIAFINYSTNVITLASPTNWSSGSAVYLYQDSNGNVQLNPNAAGPNIGAYQGGPTRPEINWVIPGAIAYGTPLSATQLDATASVPGTFVYSPAAGTVLSAGTQALSVIFTPTDTTDYTTASDMVTITVNRTAPMLTWTTPAAINYGTALSSTQLDATASVAGTFVYSPAAGAIEGGGSDLLSVTFTPADGIDYSTATASVTLQVNPATPTINWPRPAAITYGTPLSNTQLDATATFNGATVTGMFVYTPAVNTVLAAGVNTLSVTFTPTNTTNYTSASGSVTLQVNQATPTLSWAKPAPITQGTPLSGTQLDATASVPGTFAYSPAAGTVLKAGTYTLSVTFTPTDNVDYRIATDSVTLKVK